MSRIKSVEECDANAVEGRTKDRYKKIRTKDETHCIRSNHGRIDDCLQT
jgi:hypothetical protein